MKRSLGDFLQETVSGFPCEAEANAEETLRVERVDVTVPLELHLRRHGSAQALYAQPVRGRLQTGFSVALGRLRVVAETTTAPQENAPSIERRKL